MTKEHHRILFLFEPWQNLACEVGGELGEGVVFWSQGF